jgi:hypothetical protein
MSSLFILKEEFFILLFLFLIIIDGPLQDLEAYLSTMNNPGKMPSHYQRL